MSCWFFTPSSLLIQTKARSDHILWPIISDLTNGNVYTSFLSWTIKMRYSGADIWNPISQADKFIFHGNKTLEVDGLHSKILWPKQLNTKMSSGASLWWMTTPVNSWKTNPYKRSSTRTVHLKFLSRFERFLWWGQIQKAGTTSQFQVSNSKKSC